MANMDIKKIASTLRAVLGEIEKGDGYVAAENLLRAIKSIAANPDEDLNEAIYGGVGSKGSALAQKACVVLFQHTDTATDHTLLRYFASSEFSTQQEDNYLQLDDDDEAGRYRNLLKRIVKNLGGLLSEIDKIESGKR